MREMRIFTDIITIFWKEHREYKLAYRGRAGWGMVMFLLLTGGLIPWQLGELWVKGSLALVMLTWFSVMPGMMMNADSIAGERERHTLETLLASRLDNRSILLGKAILPIIYALLFTIIMLLLGWAVVNLKLRLGMLPGSDPKHFLFYRPEVLWGAPLLSLAMGTFSNLVGVLVSLRAPTVKKAQQTLSLGFTVLWLVPVFGGQLLPRPWRHQVFESFKNSNPTQTILAGALVLLMVNLFLYALARARFQRHKLILD